MHVHRADIDIISHLSRLVASRSAAFDVIPAARHQCNLWYLHGASVSCFRSPASHRCCSGVLPAACLRVRRGILRCLPMNLVMRYCMFSGVTPLLLAFISFAHNDPSRTASAVPFLTVVLGIFTAMVPFCVLSSPSTSGLSSISFPHSRCCALSIFVIFLTPLISPILALKPLIRLNMLRVLDTCLRFRVTHIICVHLSLLRVCCTHHFHRFSVSSIAPV